MKTKKVWVSRHQLTRCASCGRHHQIDDQLSAAELLKLSCDFCDGQLIIASAHAEGLERASAWSGRSSKIAMGLLSASLTMSACEPSEEVETSAGDTPVAGEVAGEISAGDLSPAGDAIAQPAYGVFPAGEEAGVAVAGEEAGAGVAVPPYGSFGAEEAGDIPMELDMEVAGDDSPQPEYGAFPAGEDVDPPEEEEPPIEVDMAVAGDDSPQPEYGAFPAGEEG